MDQTQVSGSAQEVCYQLSHLTGPLLYFHSCETKEETVGRLLENQLNRTLETSCAFMVNWPLTLMAENKMCFF